MSRGGAALGRGWVWGRGPGLPILGGRGEGPLRGAPGMEAPPRRDSSVATRHWLSLPHLPTLPAPASWASQGRPRH